MDESRTPDRGECARCGAAFPKTKPERVYCSKRCAVKAWQEANREYTYLPCAVCGSEFKRLRPRQKYCGQPCADIAERERRRAKNSGTGKGWSKGMRFVELKLTCEQCGKRYHCPPSQAKRRTAGFCSKRCYGRYIATHPERFAQVQGRRGNGGKREDLGGMYVRSAWEANWARYLNWLLAHGEIREWSYEPETFEFHAIKRGTRFYTPDFKVVEKNGSVVYHEVKGYMDQPSRTKLDRMARYYPDVKIVLVDAPVYKEVARKVGPMIRGWETVEGRVAKNG